MAEPANGIRRMSQGGTKPFAATKLDTEPKSTAVAKTLIDPYATLPENANEYTIINATPQQQIARMTASPRTTGRASLGAGLVLFISMMPRDWARGPDTA